METKVYQKLMTVQSKLKAPKDCRNDFGGYKYRKAEDILEAVKPILAEVGAIVKIEDTIEQIGDRFYVKAVATFIDIDDSRAICTSAYAREPLSKKGMDDAQVTGSTSSYARKYALNGLFAIDDSSDDPDVTNKHGNDSPAPAPAPAKPAAKKPATAPSKGKEAWAKFKALDEVRKMDESKRNAEWTKILKNACGKISASELTDADWDKVMNEISVRNCI